MPAVGLAASIPNYPSLTNGNSSITHEGSSESSTNELNNFGNPSQPAFSTSTALSIGTNSQKTTAALQPTIYYPNTQMPNPFSSFWNDSFMYNNPSQYGQYLNHAQTLANHTNPMAATHMIGHALRFPNFAPVLQSSHRSQCYFQV